MTKRSSTAKYHLTKYPKTNPKVESSESNYYADNFLSVVFLANITLVDFNAFLVQFPLYFNQLPLIMFMRKPLYTA